jgi:SPX domain protein involved in polyphosphate accumulation
LEDVTEEYFCRKFEAELARVETFTLSQVTALRHAISQVEEALVLQKNYNQKNQAQNNNKWTQRTDQLSEDFLRLEKYVNINFMGFHKILKKHDKYLPHTPCKSFYVARMHAQAWVRGDYSDVVVRMSQIYTTLRDEDYSSASRISTPPPSPQETTSPSPTATVQQRSIAKYWIKTEDVSRVKYAVLRHLPVMLQKKDGSTGQQVDSVLTNSVYLDNAQLGT